MALLDRVEEKRAMSEFLSRVLALIEYKSVFYAPGITGQGARKRLMWLGYTWDGHKWARPSREVFVRQVMSRTWPF
jgi:hypothetical protein